MVSFLLSLFMIWIPTTTIPMWFIDVSQVSHPVNQPLLIFWGWWPLIRMSVHDSCSLNLKCPWGTQDGCTCYDNKHIFQWPMGTGVEHATPSKTLSQCDTTTLWTEPHIYTGAIPLEFWLSCITPATDLKLLIGPSNSMNPIFLTGGTFIFKAPQRKMCPF